MSDKPAEPSPPRSTYTASEKCNALKVLDMITHTLKGGLSSTHPEFQVTVEICDLFKSCLEQALSEEFKEDGSPPSDSYATLTRLAGLIRGIPYEQSASFDARQRAVRQWRAIHQASELLAGILQRQSIQDNA